MKFNILNFYLAYKILNIPYIPLIPDPFKDHFRWSFHIHTTLPQSEWMTIIYFLEGNIHLTRY
jgi:hypothetical protein